MAIQQHQLADESSIEAAIHHVLLTIIGGGWSLVHARRTELMFAFSVERSYYSTIVFSNVGCHLSLERVIMLNRASLRIIRTNGEVAGSIAGANQSGWCV
jgi:hypothetical protein